MNPGPGLSRVGRAEEEEGEDRSVVGRVFKRGDLQQIKVGGNWRASVSRAGSDFNENGFAGGFDTKICLKPCERL